MKTKCKPYDKPLQHLTEEQLLTMEVKCPFCGETLQFIERDPSDWGMYNGLKYIFQHRGSESYFRPFCFGKATYFIPDTEES